MRNLVMLAGLLGLAGVLFVSCEKQPPLTNGKNILTLEQYKQLQTKMGAVEKKKEEAVQSIRANPFSEGTAYLRQEQYKQAAVSFEQAVKVEPNNSRAWYLLGTCYEKNDQIEQAQLAYKTSYDLMVKQGYIPGNDAFYLR